MILTGKAKEEFFNWLDNQGVNGIDISNWEFEKFQLLSNVSQNALKRFSKKSNSSLAWIG